MPGDPVARPSQSHTPPLARKILIPSLAGENRVLVISVRVGETEGNIERWV